MKIDVGITVFARPMRLVKIFESFEQFGWPEREDVCVFEDPSDSENAWVYKYLCAQYGVRHRVAPQWGCMQGIIQYAMENTDGEWFVYLPDDVLPTPNSMDFVRQWITTLPEEVGALQIPYWNVGPAGDGNLPDNAGPPSGNMFEGSLDWLRRVPLNPHWWGPALYVNVNGAGFALRRKVWEQVGGFSQKTWCLDEDISCKIWLKTNEYVILTVPGPPWLHQGGASTPDQHKYGHAHGRWAKIDGWLDEWGKDKDVLGQLCREVMRERGEKYGWPVR